MSVSHRLQIIDTSGEELPVTVRADPTQAPPFRYVPLSVREGGRRKRFGWWVRGARHRAALKLAPWLDRPL